MAIAKWSMYLTAVLFVLIGVGALAVAVVPGADEWFAEQVLDRSGVPEDAFGDDTVSLVADSDGVQLTAWIFVITFLPTAALFVWIGRWFKSMEASMSSMFGSASTMAADSAASMAQARVPAAPGGRCLTPRRCRPSSLRCPSSAIRPSNPPTPRRGASSPESGAGGGRAAGYGRSVLVDALLARARLVSGRGTTVGSFLHQSASVRRDHCLVEEADGTSLTQSEGAGRVDLLAGSLASQVVVGDRVVVATENTYDQFLACLAVCRVGGIAVPINPHMRPEEVDHVVADAGAAVVLRDVDDLDPAPPLDHSLVEDPSSTAMLFYTSGTTGRPKGVALSHKGLLGSLTVGALWPGIGRADEAVVSLPIAHIMGFITLLGLASVGIPVWFLPRFSAPGVLDAIEERRASVFVGVPAMYRMMEEAGAAERDLTSVRVWVSGADAMPGELARTFKGYGATATLPLLGPVGEAAFVEGYGMVELGGGVATKVSPPLLGVGLGDSLGLPLPGYRFQVTGEDGHPVGRGQEGELWVRGPGLLEGYWGSPRRPGTWSPTTAGSAPATWPDGGSWARPSSPAARRT